MTPLYLLSVQLSIFFATALLSVWFMTRTTPAVKRLYGVTRLVPESRHRPTQSSQRIRETAFRILHGAISRMGMTMGDKLQMRFRSAGLHTQNCVDGYFAVRLLGPVAVLLFWTFFRDIGFFPIALMAAGAYLGPDLWLTARAKRRRGQIRLGLADALDLMVVCVDAGLGLDQALLRTGQELATSHPVIAEEFMLTRPLLEAITATDPVVLLIDEVDRVELETEALMLEILSEYQVSIPELGTVRAKQIPMVFLTSNNTRELSEALKRRCLYLYVDYPSVERERDIILSRVPGISSALAEQIAQVVRSLRTIDLKKAPSVSETLDWARTLVVLGREEIGDEDARATLHILLKYQSDIERATKELLGRSRPVA